MVRKSKILMAALVAGTTLTATTAWAQFGGQPFPGVPAAMPPSRPFGGGPNPPGGPFGGPGGGRSMMPFAFGSISAVNIAAGTITLSPSPGENTGQTIKVAEKARISAQKEVKLSDLKVGESVQVEGTPTGITASQINAGEETSGFGSGNPFGQGGPNGGMGGNEVGGSAFAQARGKITSVNPLTISLSDKVSVIIKAAPGIKIIKTVTEKLIDLKIGDSVMAGGQSDASGVLTADSLQVNMGRSGGFFGPSRPGFH